MAFKKSDVTTVGKLARISLRNEEIDHLEDDLHRIVNFVAQLNEINVDSVTPMFHAGDFFLPLRTDKAEDSIGRECIRSSAGYEDGLIKVPKIIE